MTLADWVIRTFTRAPELPEHIRNAYISVFGSHDGQIVLQHLVDHCYATITYSKDPIELATHNGRRSVVHEVLEIIHQKESYGRIESVSDRQ